jgi:hypothetical protein
MRHRWPFDDGDMVMLKTFAGSWRGRLWPVVPPGVSEGPYLAPLRARTFRA